MSSYSVINEVITLRWHHLSSCTIRLHGGTISSWRVNDKEQIFVSRLSKYDWLSTITGGISLVFPQFSYPEELDCDYARLVKWRIIQPPQVIEEHDVETTIEFRSDCYSLVRSRSDFCIRTKIRLYEKDLLVFHQVINTKKKVMGFNLSMRVFLNTPIKTSFVGGLEKSEFRDMMKKRTGRIEDVFLPYDKLEMLFLKRKKPSIGIGYFNKYEVINFRTINFPELLLWNEEAESLPHNFVLDRSEKHKMICFEPIYMKPIELDHKCSIGAGVLLSLIKVKPCQSVKCKLSKATHVMPPFPTDIYTKEGILNLDNFFWKNVEILPKQGSSDQETSDKKSKEKKSDEKKSLTCGFSKNKTKKKL